MLLSERLETIPYEQRYKFRNKVQQTLASRQSTYHDDGRFKDSEGIKWLYTKNADEYTLKCAIIEGYLDTNRSKVRQIYDLYSNATSKFDLDRIIKKDPDLQKLVNTIISFLDQFKNKTVTVYRGFMFDKKDFDIIKGMTAKDILSNKLLRKFSNTTKEFNSFSTSVFTAAGFAGALSYKSPLDAFRMDRNADRYNKDSMQIANRYFIDNLQDNTPQYAKLLISAEATPNNISFAFTAYILARHGGIKHSELNINNVSELKNPKIIYSNLSKFIK